MTHNNMWQGQVCKMSAHGLCGSKICYNADIFKQHSFYSHSQENATYKSSANTGHSLTICGTVMHKYNSKETESTFSRFSNFQLFKCYEKAVFCLDALSWLQHYILLLYVCYSTFLKYSITPDFSFTFYAPVVNLHLKNWNLHLKTYLLYFFHVHPHI